MSENKAITNFENQKDDEIGGTAATAILALTGNADFTFTTQLSDVVTAKATYVLKLAAVATGNSASVDAKDISKVVLETKMNVLAVEVNLQAKGDLVKLKGSGLVLAKLPSHHTMDIPSDFKVLRGNIAGTMEVSVAKPIYTTHGTIFAFWKPSLGATPANINDWFFRHANGHSLKITGLTPNVSYPFAAALKGMDDEALVWSAITTKSAGD